jgi:hypothetical protein
VAADLPPPPNPSREQLQVHALQQVGELEVCDRKRALAVAASDLHNMAVDRLVTDLRPARGWERVFGKKTPKSTAYERLVLP